MRSAWLLVAVSLALAGAPADAAPRVGQLAEVPFDAGSARVRIDAKVQLGLGEVAGWALDNPAALVVIDAHPDKRGRTAANIKLALARARAVRDQLVALGVDPDQLVLAAYGDAARPRRVVVWGTRAGLAAVVARTRARGHAELWTGRLTAIDRGTRVIAGR